MPQSWDTAWSLPYTVQKKTSIEKVEQVIDAEDGFFWRCGRY
jgi:hypothetical protein